MKADPNPVRILLPNTAWLHISELRADWGPWGTSVFVSPACVEAAYQTLPAYHDPNPQIVAAFFQSVLKAIQTSPPRDLPELQVQIGLFEFRFGEESTDILLGVRAEQSGELYLAAPEDWRES